MKELRDLKDLTIHDVQPVSDEHWASGGDPAGSHTSVTAICSCLCTARDSFKPRMRAIASRQSQISNLKWGMM